MLDYTFFQNKSLMTTWICYPLGGWNQKSSSWFGTEEKDNIMYLISSDKKIKLCRNPANLHLYLEQSEFERYFIPLPRYHFIKVYGDLYGPLDLPKIGQEWKNRKNAEIVDVLDTFFDTEKLCGYIYFEDRNKRVNSLRIQDFVEIYDLAYDNAYDHLKVPYPKKYA